MKLAKNKQNLTVVMPVYNEEECIELVVNAWYTYLKSSTQIQKFKLIIVDDGSTDKTPYILKNLEKNLEELQIIQKPNGGHGSALMLGYSLAINEENDWIFQTDSDNQFVPIDLEKFWNTHSGEGFLLGARMARKDATSRLFISWGLRQLLKIMFGVSIKDANIPYRSMRRVWLKDQLSRLPEDAKAPNVMLSILAGRQFGEVTTIPVAHLPRKTGNTVLISGYLFRLCRNIFKQLIAFRKTIKGGHSQQG